MSVQQRPSGIVDRGTRRPPIQLPGAALICFTVDFGFEAFSRACQYRLRPAAPDQPDPYSLSFAEYGLRVGVWRLLELAEEFKLVAGVAVNGYAAQRYPETLKALSGAGHEIIAHGWTNDPGVASDDEEVEQAEVGNTLQAIASVVECAPKGWMSPGYAGSPARLKAIVGHGLLYSCDDAADDLPYAVEVGSKTHVIMPRTSFGSNDLTNWFAPRHAPSTWLSAFKSQFDAIYSEALRGRPGWMELFLHAHFAGRPQALLEIKEMIKYARGHEGVWTTTRGEFARWIHDNPQFHG